METDGKTSKKDRRAGVRVVKLKKDAARESLAAAGFFLRRVGSGLIDLMIWIVIGLGLFKGAAFFGGGSIHGSAGEWVFLVILPLLFMVGIFALVYGALFGSIAGRTPGMMLFGLKMTDECGDKPGLIKALAKTGLFFLSVLPIGLGLLLAFKGEGKGTYFDRITGVNVVKA